MDIKDVINKIKKNYPEIVWGNSGISFSLNKQNQILVQYSRDELIQHFKNNYKFLLINTFSDSSVNWKAELANYFVITELVEEATAGNIEITKKRKIEEISNKLGNDYFIIEQDFFICHVIKVETESESYLNIVNEIIGFKDIDEFTNSLEIELDNWNDYGYYNMLNITIWDTDYSLRVNPRSENMINYLKGEEKKPSVDDLCSLGDEVYYEFLKKYLPYSVRDEWLKLTNDLSYNIEELDRISKKYKYYKDPFASKFTIKQPQGLEHNFFNNSFMRTTSVTEIKDIFHPLTIYGISGDKLSEIQSESENIKKSVDDSVTTIQYSFEEDGIEKGILQFDKHNSSDLPMNVYGVVGGNGSGKSYKISKIIRDHIEGDNNFSQILHFSLSPFDNNIKYTDGGEEKLLGSLFQNEEEDVIYEKIGFSSINNPLIEDLVTKLDSLGLGDIKNFIIKKNKILFDENKELIPNAQEKIDIGTSFNWYIQILLLDLIASDTKIGYWKECLKYFLFEPWVKDVIEAFEDKIINLEDYKKIIKLSSGQSTILLYLTKLVSSVNKGSLIIFDEPETFMHPPMMKAFIRAVSEIITQTNAFCLVATHSPVIIQEIPHSNVYKLNLDHKIYKVGYKTYGQNLGSLYKNIYGVELQQTGYNEFLIERKEKKLIDGDGGDLLEENDIKYLGDEAYLKYLLIKDEVNQQYRKEDKIDEESQ
ncbi:AAA family ATPase [Floricoccus penangensis]|uniref:AAA family ATPase n=1 Tax=Floricoccus penangensis TaxID=1859475 RepID=UPI00203DE073|nr:AAA family ATPase [Floricoccus penangensis]URZ87133.1 AAA family ATPase [Floricoccus penangensis]